MTLDGRAWAKAWTADIGRALKRERQARGMSQQELADATQRLGYAVSRNTVVNIEGGRAETITVQQLAVLAAALNASPAELAFDVREPTEVEATPGEFGTRFWAAEWFSGRRWFHDDPDERWGRVPPSVLTYWRTHDDLLHQLESLLATISLADEDGDLDARVRHVGERIADSERALRMWRDSMRAQEMPLPPLPEDVAAVVDAPFFRATAVTIEAVGAGRRLDPEGGSDGEHQEA